MSSVIHYMQIGLISLSSCASNEHADHVAQNEGRHPWSWRSVTSNAMPQFDTLCRTMLHRSRTFHALQSRREWYRDPWLEGGELNSQPRGSPGQQVDLLCSKDDISFPRGDALLQHPSHFVRQEGPVPLHSWGRRGPFDLKFRRPLHFMASGLSLHG